MPPIVLLAMTQVMLTEMPTQICAGLRVDASPLISLRQSCPQNIRRNVRVNCRELSRHDPSIVRATAGQLLGSVLAIPAQLPGNFPVISEQFPHSSPAIAEMCLGNIHEHAQSTNSPRIIHGHETDTNFPRLWTSQSRVQPLRPKPQVQVVVVDAFFGMALRLPQPPVCLRCY